MYYTGVDIGGTKIAVAIFNEDRDILIKRKISTDLTAAPENLCSGIIRLIDDLLSELSATRDELLGIGIGCPSTVDFNKGSVYRTANIPMLKNFEMKQFFLRYFSCNILIDNDANLAALAEHRRGAGKGHGDMVYCTVSTGIGGGFIFDGHIYHGSNGFAGEIGHSIITPGQGILCGCKNRGCIESYAGGAHISNQVAQRLSVGQKTIMTDLCALEKIDGHILLQAFTARDNMATEIFDQIAYYVGVLLFNIYQMLNISCFVIGGGLIKGFGNLLFSEITKIFNSYERLDDHPVHILPSELSEDFGIIGACELLFDA